MAQRHKARRLWLPWRSRTRALNARLWDRVPTDGHTGGDDPISAAIGCFMFILVLPWLVPAILILPFFLAECLLQWLFALPVLLVRSLGGSARAGPGDGGRPSSRRSPSPDGARRSATSSRSTRALCRRTSVTPGCHRAPRRSAGGKRPSSVRPGTARTAGPPTHPSGSTLHRTRAPTPHLRISSAASAISGVHGADGERPHAEGRFLRLRYTSSDRLMP